MITKTDTDSSTSPSSRFSQTGAGWQCQQVGTYRELLPHGDRPFSWINPLPLWRSRNDLLARWFGDPINDLRRAWIARQLAAGISPEFTIREYAGREAVSFAVLGDTGEGDGSQYALIPGLERIGYDADFLVICSDIIYPAGGIGDYKNKFYRPYRHYPRPIYALPGNHDWYDDLTGFMVHFCGSPINERPTVAGPGPRWKRALRRLLWRRAPKGDAAEVAQMRQMRSQPEQQVTQPGPYFAIEAGPVVLVCIDTGITAGLDRDQGAWLRRVSADSPKPKILLTGRPLVADGQLHPGSIEDAYDTVDDIVRAPEHNYIAAIGGDIHNYQRYPVTVDGDRTNQYVVSGGGGAFMNATHKIPNIDHCGLDGVGETDFRCYPLREDSLALFSRVYDRRFGLGTGLFRITPAQAVKLLAERLETQLVRQKEEVSVGRWKRFVIDRLIFPLPGRGHGFLQPIFSELLDTNKPPMFKHFLRIDATQNEVTIRCYAASGCLDHECNPPVEDTVRCIRGTDDRWTWQGPSHS